jgi:hypothetical protein
MLSRMRSLRFLAATVIVVSVTALLGARNLVVAQSLLNSGGGKSCPLVLAYDQGIKAEVVGIIFTDEVQGSSGNRMRLNEDQKAKMRIGVVSIKITKPAEQRLTLAAADVTLHYFHGENAEVSPCEGISAFSTNNDADRPMELSRTMGPGFVKQTTGARATAASEVYIDAVFGFIEPNTSEVWICLGQPGVKQGFKTKGWFPEQPKK